MKAYSINLRMHKKYKMYNKYKKYKKDKKYGYGGYEYGYGYGRRPDGEAGEDGSSGGQI